MSRKNKLLAALFTIGCIVIICVAVFVKIAVKGNIFDDNVMCDGTTIDGVKVGELTKEEARAKLDKYIEEAGMRKIQVAVGDNTVSTTYSGVGITYNDEDVIDDAFNIGKKGNFFERIYKIATLKDSDLQLKLDYKVDESQVRQFVETDCTQYDVKARNSKLKYQNGKLRATKERTGQEVQIDETVDELLKNIDTNISEDGVSMDAVVKVTKPKYTKKMLSKCRNVLGKYATSYATSTADRANNVQTAAGYINGTVLYPGQTFSMIKVIKDRTEANGYKAAPEYSSGKVVSGIGGGVCQVSTTLYNAVLNAELEVVERSPHSMVVAYVDVSRDAAIAGDYKDFKFKNSTKSPIYISASTAGGLISFKIYGEETREANRTIEFESEILETIQPGKEVVTQDDTLPASYRAVTQSAHVGYKAKLWKKIYIDGVQKDRVEVNSSTYSAEPQYVTVGKQAQPAIAPQTSPSPDASKAPDAADNKTNSGSTAAPKATPQPSQNPKATKVPAATIKPKNDTE